MKYRKHLNQYERAQVLRALEKPATPNSILEARVSDAMAAYERYAIASAVAEAELRRLHRFLDLSNLLENPR